MTDKITKAQADYRTTSRGREQCLKCSMFRLMNRCTLVEGVISPFGWCRFFEAKEKKP